MMSAHPFFPVIMSVQDTPVPRALIPERKMMYYLFLLGFFAIFSTTISKNPVLPLFSQAIGADGPVIGLIAAFSPLPASFSRSRSG